MNPLDSLPPQPSAENTAAYNAWVSQYNAALENYRAAYAARMAELGVSVSFSKPDAAAAGSPVGLVDTVVATLTKDGFSSTAIVSAGRGNGTDPRDLADFDATYNLKFQGQYTSPAGTVPSEWYEPQPQWNQYTNPAMFQPTNVPGAFFPTSVPGPSPTVPAGTHSSQTVQAPSTPDAGTLVTPPTASTPQNPVVPASGKMTFWEWNWHYENATGRVGPPPEAVGVASGNTLLTEAEWWAAVGPWHTGNGGGGTPPAGAGGGDGGGTPTTPPPPVQTPPEEDNTLLYVGLAVGAFLLLKGGN